MNVSIFSVYGKGVVFGGEGGQLCVIPKPLKQN